MPHVLLKCDDPGSRRAAASTRFDVLLFRALMGEDSAAVSRHSHSVQDGYLHRQLASSFMYERLRVCDALVLCPDVCGRVAPGRETVTQFGLFKRCESRTRRSKLVNRKKVTEELQTACRLLYLKRQMTNKAALTCLVLSVKGRRGAGCHIVSASMLDQEEEEEVQMVFKMEDLSEMSTHLEV